MLDTKARKFVQPIFNSLGKGLTALKLTPNTVTIFGFLLGLLSAVSLSFNYLIASLVLLWLSGLFDVLDGTVARLMGQSSKLGAYLDLVFDRIVEGAMILGFYFYKPELSLYLLLFMVGAMFNFTTFLVAASLFDNEGEKSVHYDIGIVERTETFILFTLMMLFPQLSVICLIIFNCFMFLTGIIRFNRIIQHENVN